MAKRKYNYIRKKIAHGTWQSLTSGALSLLLLFFCIFLSILYQGSGPLLIGALGLSSLLASVISLYYVLQGLREAESNQWGIRIAGIGSGVLVIFWLLLIFVGIRLS